MSGRALVAAMIGASLLAGCSGLAFRDPGVLTITFPPDRSRVELPVRIAWDATELTEGQTYAVFVDRTPPRPGLTIDEAFDAEERAGIHLTDDDEILLGEMAVRGGVPDRDRDRHEVTVVVLGPDGRRVGEYAAVRELHVVRDRP